jgi:hypothetical protein
MPDRSETANPAKAAVMLNAVSLLIVAQNLCIRRTSIVRIAQSASARETLI